ncbi:MAG: hypothetical protein FWD05_12060 [Oscillospiraceae bacterium]|nr:hypothetical protein [Oscillospiraceae bacterium]
MVIQARQLFPDSIVFKLDLPEELRFVRLTKRGTKITLQDEDRYDAISGDILLSTIGTPEEVFNRFKKALKNHF